MSEKEPKRKKRPWLPDEDEIPKTNIWGWRFSMLGLVLILILSILFAYQYCSLQQEAEQRGEEFELFPDTL